MSSTSAATELGGGSLLLAWQLKDKKVLIVGGGDVAAGRIESVLVANPFVTVVCPKRGLCPQAAHLITSYPTRITHVDRAFAPDDIEDAYMVLTAIDSVEDSRQIVELCRTRRILVNAADIPPSCDFYFGSQIRDGPLQIMISTNGNGPRLANIIRRRMQASIPSHTGDAIRRVGELRVKLKERAPGVGGELGRKRMKWMTKLCDQWSLEELSEMSEPIMEKLLDEGWEKGTVPSPRQVGGGKPFWSSVQAIQTSSVLVGTVGFAAGALFTLVVFHRSRLVPLLNHS